MDAKTIVSELAKLIKLIGVYMYEDRPGEAAEDLFAEMAKSISTKPVNDILDLFVEIINTKTPRTKIEHRKFLLQLIAGHFTNQAILDALNADKRLKDIPFNAVARTTPHQTTLDYMEEWFKQCEKM